MNKVKTAIRIAELAGLSLTVARVFNADEKAQKDAFLKPNVKNLEELANNTQTAILQNKTLSTLEDADNERDEAVKTLGTLVNAYSIIPIESKKALALPLKEIFEKYAKAQITAVNYNAESTLIGSLLEDFASPSLAENEAGLDGITEALAEIRSKQDAFSKANDDFVKASKSKADSASSFKKPILSLFNDKIIPYLNTMRIVENADCADFANSVEGEIERANETVSKRNSKK